MTTESASLESITIGGLTVRYLIDGSAEKGMGVFELTIAPGADVPPPHGYKFNEKCAYALEGRLRYSVDGVVEDLAHGQCMHTPKGSVHVFNNPHNTLAKALIVLSSDLGVQYFRDIRAVAGLGTLPDRQKLLEVMPKYGLIPATPGPAIGQSCPQGGDPAS